MNIPLLVSCDLMVIQDIQEVSQYIEVKFVIRMPGCCFTISSKMKRWTPWQWMNSCHCGPPPWCSGTPSTSSGLSMTRTLLQVSDKKEMDQLLSRRIMKTSWCFKGVIRTVYHCLVFTVSSCNVNITWPGTHLISRPVILSWSWTVFWRTMQTLFQAHAF